MPKLFTFLKRTDPSKLYARDLKPGMLVPLEGKMVTVKSVTWMNGQNGNKSLLIAGNGRPSAVALKVEFIDDEPVYAHPGAVVTSRTQAAVTLEN